MKLDYYLEEAKKNNEKKQYINLEKFDEKPKSKGKKNFKKII